MDDKTKLTERELVQFNQSLGKNISQLPVEEQVLFFKVAVQHYNFNGACESGFYRRFSPPRGSSDVVTLSSIMGKEYEPVSIAEVIERRLNAPEDVRPLWSDGQFYTNDAVVYVPTTKELKFVLDFPLLGMETHWEERDNKYVYKDTTSTRKLEGDNTFSVSLDDFLQKAAGKGFIKENGVWQPETLLVGKIWDHLGRGGNLTEYLNTIHRRFCEDDLSYMVGDYRRGEIEREENEEWRKGRTGSLSVETKHSIKERVSAFKACESKKPFLCLNNSKTYFWQDRPSVSPLIISNLSYRSNLYDTNTYPHLAPVSFTIGMPSNRQHQKQEINEIVRQLLGLKSTDLNRLKELLLSMSDHPPKESK